MGKKIDAEELYHRMYDEAFEKDSDLQKWDSGCWIRFKLFENVLKDMPEVEEKTGHWIEQDGYDGDTYYDCSECGESFCLIEGTPTDNLYNYCPNCGAEMKGENNES